MKCRLALIVALLLSATARAADPEAFSPMQGSRLQLETDYWPGIDGQFAAMALDAQVQVHRNIALDIEVPWALGQIAHIGDPTVHAAGGNVTLGLHGVGNVRPDLVLWGGLSASVPTQYGFSGSSAGTDVLTVLYLAALARDDFQENRFFPQFAFLRAPVGLEIRFARYWRYRFEIAALLWFALDAGATPQIGLLGSWNSIASIGNAKSAWLSVESYSEIEAQLPAGLVAGLRLQFVTVSDAFTQPLFLLFSPLSAEPYVGYESAGPGIVARLGVLVGEYPTPCTSDYLCFPSFTFASSVHLNLGWKF